MLIKSSEEEKKVLEFIDSKYDNFSLDEKKEIHNLYNLNKDNPEEFSELIKKFEKFIFKIQPPTPEEYLDHRNGWITKPFADAIYSHVRDDFLEILDPTKNYQQAVEYGATRLGKSYLVRMIIHYIIIYTHCLRQPQLYYGLSPTTSLSIYLMSFVNEKVNQLLLDPIYKIFQMSPRMKQIHLQDKVKKEQEEIGPNTIVWSKASTFGHITLASGVSLNSGTDFMSFLGADLLFLSVSEINFFIQKGGTTHEEIFQLYTDGLERIQATVGNNYLGMVYLDSSANDIENSIEHYILNELQQDKDVFFRQRARWDCEQHIEKYTKWLKTKETFKVCTGDGATPPQIIENETQLQNIDKRLIINVPIDLKKTFKKNITKSIKDIGGRPTTRENKFISDYKLIAGMFDSNIHNIIDGIKADASETPDKLIWNRFYKDFFTTSIEGKHVLKRATLEPRWLHVDHAHSSEGDLMGITMMHKEYSIKEEKILHIADFSLCILPGKTGINLAAVEQFIMDLRDLGNVYIKLVSSDSFQNATFKQNLIRTKIETIITSVDRTIDPYVLLRNLMFDGTVRMGRNIFVKNNLSCLMEEKDKKDKVKVNHSKGKVQRSYNGDWEKSDAGKNSKDCSDPLAGANFNMFNNDYIPTAIYESENVKFSQKGEDKIVRVEDAMKNLLQYY